MIVMQVDYVMCNDNGLIDSDYGKNRKIWFFVKGWLNIIMIKYWDLI